MNILVLGTPFYHYIDKIIYELKSQGNTVSYFEEVPKNYLAVKRIFGDSIEKSYIRRFQEKFLRGDFGLKYDFVLVLVGRYLTPEFLDQIREFNKNAIFVLYLWDDIARVENFKLVKNKYDSIFSFDNVDCNKFRNLKFLPLFYTQDYRRSNRESKSYDVYGSFTDHSERRKIAVSVCKQSLLNGHSSKFIFVPGRFGYLKNYVRNRNIERITKGAVSFRYQAVDMQENIDYVHKSKALLDVQYGSQNGLTMRSIEALGAGVKLITTNSNIVKYDFFNANNCLVIDRNNPVIHPEFFEIPYIDLPVDLYEKYSLHSWVSVIMGKKKYVYLK